MERSPSTMRRMPNTILAELHSHSTWSDGTLDVPTLAQRLHQAKVRVWSLTDHDTCGGCSEAAHEAANLGIRFVPGLEISAWAGRSVHVLGYGVDLQAIAAYQTQRTTMRAERVGEMIRRLTGLGVPITREQVDAEASGGVLTRPHVARALFASGQVVSVQEAFDVYLGVGRPAYVESEWPSVVEAIGLIHDAGGIAILAHPGIYDLDRSIPEWVEAGLDGIEVGHPKHTDAQRDAYRGLANQHRILKTVSSDYHGPGLGQVEPGQTRILRQWLLEFFDALGLDTPQEWM